MPTGQGTDYCHNAIAGCFSKPANPVQWRIRYIRFALSCHKSAAITGHFCLAKKVPFLLCVDTPKY